MSNLLPTGVFGTWTVASFRDSIIEELRRKSDLTTLQLFFYAVTLSGWNEVAVPIRRWRSASSRRSVTMYVGTDHGITDPDALEAMRKADVDVRLMKSYSGVFHPKVAWLSGSKGNLVWVGSNNLTRDGLANNIEFAALIRAAQAPSELSDWAKEVHAGSTPIDDSLVQSYRSEREKFERDRAAAKSLTFTWSRRTEPATQASLRPRRGDLIVEIMPDETRGGNQVQLPKKAVKEFFDLSSVGDKVSIRLKQKGAGPFRSLLITVFSNNTVRVSINELEYRDRPCVVVFRKLSPSKLDFEFEIVPKSIFPARYKSLLAACINQTRYGSRRWVIV